MSIFSRSSFSRPRGFTLIELLVVLAIVLIVSTVILFSAGRFNSAILLRSLAYEIGLSLREAQLYGVAVKETAPGSGNFSAAYGIYIPSSILGVERGTYPLFADLNANGLYDDGASSVVENFTLQNYFTLENVCALRSGTLRCFAACPSPLPLGAVGCTPSSISWLSVTFKRPDPNAIIKTDLESGYSSAYITVLSQNGSTRSVSVSATGQIGIVGGEQ
jgi:prepilin-type N-terminal cleavage/methylation domain-containing protein